MSHNLNSTITVIGIDIGKNSFHIVGLDERGGIVLRQKWSRGQVEARLANMPACLIGMEACPGAVDGAKAERTRPHGPDHSGAIRQAICEVEQERRASCLSHRRSSHPARYAVR